MSKRDRAILAIVKSGLVDEHIGLEIFDKGDFTSTKEDKKIRLIRAINGELSRLVRKIPPIENAQVFFFFPEQSLFLFRYKSNECGMYEFQSHPLFLPDENLSVENLCKIQAVLLYLQKFRLANIPDALILLSKE